MPSTTAAVLRNALALAGGVTAMLLVVLSSSLPRSDRVAAVFPPWWSAADRFAAAAGAGRIVALGRLPSVLIVHGAPALLARKLREAGALLVLDSSLSVGCRSAGSDTR